jgi:hypothetical protein
MDFTGQTLTVWAVVLLIDCLVGITVGVIGGAVYGSRRGVLLAPATDDPLSAGAREIYRVYVRDDTGYPQGLRRGDGPEPHGQEVDR